MLYLIKKKASWWLSSKESTCNARDTGDLGLIPGSGRSLGEKNGNPLQYSCLENPMDIEAWWALVHGATKSQTRLSNSAAHTCKCIASRSMIVGNTCIHVHSIFKSRDITLPTKVRQGYGFSSGHVWM